MSFRRLIYIRHRYRYRDISEELRGFSIVLWIDCKGAVNDFEGCCVEELVVDEEAHFIRANGPGSNSDTTEKEVKQGNTCA